MSLLDTDNADAGQEENEFIAAFDEYHDALFRHAFYRISDRERAIELVHDTYVQAWSYVRRDIEIASYRSFLYKILNNRIIDEYRKRKDTTSLDSILDNEAGDERYIPELHDNAHETLIASIDAKRALVHLRDIPDQYREAVVLLYIDGLSPREIAELLETTENVVSLRIHRGLKSLRKILEVREESI